MGGDRDEGVPSGSEAELRHSPALLRIAGRLARVGGWAIELPSEELFWSQEMNEILGFPASFQPTLTESLEMYPSAERERVMAALAACRDEGRPFDLELQAFDATGQQLWVRAVGEADPRPDGRLVMRGAFQDITDRKETEQRARELADRLTATFESITDALFTLDHDWRFTYLNRRAEELLQRDRASLLGRNVWEEFAPAVGGAFYDAYHRAMAEQVTATAVEFYRPLGIWIEANAYPSPDGLTVYFRDVSEQHERERSLERLAAFEQRAADRLRQLDQTKNAFLSAVSHELRTPLTMVHGLAETLRARGEALPSAQRAEIEASLLTHTERLKQLLEDLLDVDRLSSGTLSARRQPFDVASLLRTVVDRIDRRGRVQVDAPEVLHVSADELQVERIVDNLLGNTDKYAPEGAVWVRLEALGEAGFRLAVEDEGPGLEPDDLDRVFEPFYRSDPDHPRPGTGVGLSLVAEFATLHGGRAWAERGRTGGARLLVEIPGEDPAS